MGIRSAGEVIDDRSCVRNAVVQVASNAAVWSGIERAITAIRCVPEYLHGKLRHTNSAQQAANVRQLIQQTDEAIALLHDDKQSGYQLFFRYSFIAHWAYFEAFLDDFVTARMAVVPGLHERLTVHLQSGRTVAWSLSALTKKLGDDGYKKGDNFAGFVEQLLRSVEVDGLVFETRQIEVLNFSNAARNCFLHNGGIWDAKGCASAKIDVALVGTPIIITREEFLACYDVVKDILVRC